MTSDRLRKTLDRLADPRPLPRDWERLFVQDADGSRIPLNERDAARAAIERRLSVLDPAPAG